MMGELACRIMDAYADKKSLDANQIRFLYDGKRLTVDNTPEGLDMEDGDVIDAVLVGGTLLPGVHARHC